MRVSRLILLMIIILSAGVFGPSQTSNAQDCEEGFSLVEHAIGETCVPENPERIVALEWTYVEDLLTLGVQPVGVADIESYHNWVRIPEELDEDVADVGSRAEPNLEVIAELNPDLIIAVNFRVAENYDDLSAIAPTLVFDPYPSDLTSQYDEMLETFMTIASVLNLEDEGRQVLDEMDDYFAEAAEALEDAGRGEETFILSQGWTTENVATFRLFTDNAMAVEILMQIGLESAWDVDPQLYGFTEIGIEGFTEVPDTNFFYVAQGTDNTFFDESPLWSSLPFVRSGRAYWLGGDVWLFGGPRSAELLVDTVLQAMEIELEVDGDVPSDNVSEN